MVGGGKVAERKVISLMECGARVCVVSPDLTAGLTALVDSGRLEYRRGYYKSSDLKGVFLVVSASNDKEANERVVEDCSKSNILVNVVDKPEKCDFYVPAVVRRGSLQITVSTDGKSPLLARKIKEALGAEFGPEYSELVDLLGEIRFKLMASVGNEQEREKILAGLVNDEVLRLMKEGQWERVKEMITSNVCRGGRC